MLEEIKGQKCIVGIKQSLKAVESGNVCKAYVAADAENRVVQPFEQMCRLSSVPVEVVNSKKILGEACGIEVSASVAVVLK